MEPASNNDRHQMPEIHPFKMVRLQAGKSGKQAAEELGITPEWLSQVEKDRVVPSMELYRDMVKWAKGKLSLKKLIAHRKPSEHRRRKLVALKKPAKRRAQDLAAAEPAKGPDGKTPIH